jgi:two-component system KDP operon response regulator KdpE
MELNTTVALKGIEFMEHIVGSGKGSKILVIDDDPDIAKLLTIILKAQGFSIFQAFNGKDGLKRVYELHPDLIILDVMMPELNGWDVCPRIRELSDVPILMLTARSAESDLLRGFVLGADDYLKKPFSKAELEARVRALLRRKKNHHQGSDISQYTDQVLKINLETQAVELDGKAVDLSVTEFSLLACLVRNMGRTVTHSQLLREVWGCEYGNMSTTLTLYIHYLRKKLENSKHNHEYIHSQWGRGYCFIPINHN